MSEPIMQFFAYDHLKPELKAVSQPFCELAIQVESTLPRNPERSVALRKLLEAKDAAVRALIAVALLAFLGACGGEPELQSTSRTDALCQGGGPVVLPDGGVRPPHACPITLRDLGPEVHFQKALFLAELPPQTSAGPVLDPSATGFTAPPLIEIALKGAQAGQWGLVAVIALILVVGGIRWLSAAMPGFRLVAWTTTRWGGWGLTFGGSLLAALGVLFLSGGPVTVSTVVGSLVAAVVTALTSAGAVQLRQDLVGGSRSAGTAAAAGITTKEQAIREFRGPNP